MLATLFLISQHNYVLTSLPSAVQIYIYFFKEFFFFFFIT